MNFIDNYVAKALALKAKMVDKNVKLNLIAYRAIIDYLCKINKSMKGEYVMKEMVKFVVPLDTAICKALINGYCKEKWISNRVESLLGFFAKEFQVFHTESYNALMVN